MKMAKWLLKDNNEGTVLVVRTDSPTEFGRMVLYEDKKVKFYLLTDRSTSKTVGYRLDYYDFKRPRMASFNSFTYMTAVKPLKDPSKLNLEILFEDQVVRFLMYEHPSGYKDFVLIGRWRQENYDELDTEGYIRDEDHAT